MSEFKRVLVILFAFGLTGCTSTRASDSDPCEAFAKKLVSALSLDTARLDLMDKDVEYKNAYIEWMNAGTAILETENSIFKGDILGNRMRAEIQNSTKVLEYDLHPLRIDLELVCSDIFKLRAQLLATPVGRAEELKLLRFETKARRERASVGQPRLLSLYEAETDRLVKESKSAESLRKRLEADLASTKARRDRLKALVEKR